MIERGAIKLFWEAEHLDPSGDGGISEGERFGDSFPARLDEHTRQFWRYLMKEAIRAMREPTDEMVEGVAVALYEDWRNEIEPPADPAWDEAVAHEKVLWMKRARVAIRAAGIKCGSR